MTVREMLERISSSEITDWAAIFTIEDAEMAKANKGGNPSSQEDNEDLTDQLIAAIEADQAEGN